MMHNKAVSTIKKNDKKTIRAWAIFDWANSAYALVISTAIFPIYFAGCAPEFISIFGSEYPNSAVYSYSVTISYIIIALLSPLLSGMADYGGKRMYFLKIFTTIGSIFCMLLFFFKGPETVWMGTIFFMLATIGFAGSIVFYNSYLPIIATEDRLDKVSAKGYSYGYVGSVILLIFILLMIQKPLLFGITDDLLPSRIGFVLVGVWWLGFAQYSFAHLPKDNRTPTEPGFFKKGFEEIKMVFGQLKTQPDLKRFLISFFFYIAGVNTIIYVATIFAKKELNFETFELIIIVLILQLVAIIGAYLFAWLSDKTSNKLSLSAMVIIWIVICIAAYFVQSKTVFYILAAGVGMVMGGLQSLSRSTYSKMLKEDENDVTSYFSFFDVTYKVAIVLGTFLFGWVEYITGDIRNSVLVIGLLFVIGLAVLLTVDFEKAIQKS